MSRWLYTTLFRLLLPVVWLRLWWRGRRLPGYRQRWAERLGHGLPELPGCIWVHAVSVGEAVAAVPLVNALRQRYPALSVLVTTTTPTGSERVQALWGREVAHVYAPYDLPGVVQRFLDRVRPQLLVVMETELWPNWLAACKARDIPVVLANARLSERSARGYGRLGGLSREMMTGLRAIAAQDADTAARFRTLGAERGQVVVTGSLKFDMTVPADLTERVERLTAGWQLEGRPILVAASTHEGEEEQVLAAFREVLAEQPASLLLLVPRHPDRFDAVAALVRAQGLSLVRRSSQLPVRRDTQVFLGDSMGELLCWYALGQSAFVGGSLVPVGGHNMLEPLALSVPALCGPHLFNFQAIADELVAEGALAVVADPNELAATWRRWIAYPDIRKQYREAAGTVMARNRGALGRQLDLIQQAWQADGAAQARG